MVKVTAVRISRDCAPALGDVRQLGPGDWISLGPGANERADWPRYLDAIAAAISRGAEVRWK